MPNLATQLADVFRAGSPLLFCETNDDERVLRAALELGQQANAVVWQWRSTQGLYSETSCVAPPDQVTSIDALLAWLTDEANRSQWPDATQSLILIAFDAVGEGGEVTLSQIRSLKDLHTDWEPSVGNPQRRSLLMTGVGWAIPAALAGYVHTTSLPLPTRSEILEMAYRTQSMPGQPRELRTGLRRHGLSAEQFANRVRGLGRPAIDLLVRRLADLPVGADPFDLVDRIKAEEIRRTQVLEIITPRRVELGGFETFRRWFDSRHEFFHDAEGVRPHLKPRGVMLLGFPGCGKSHAARWVAQKLGVPLVAMNLGRVQDRWVGSSEARMRLALQTLEATAPVVLFIDEIEKAVAGTGTESSGVTTRLVGQLLTWLADHTVSVFVVATCNNDEQLPPELTRAGRFDASFVVRLPGDEERRQIIQIVAAELGLTIASSMCDYIVEKTGPGQSGFSGAELRQLLIEAAYVAGLRNLEIKQAHIDEALPRVSPLVRRSEGKRMLERYSSEQAKGYLSAGRS